MILLTRTGEPDVLRQKTAEWTAKLLERRKTDPKARPPSSQYAHEDVVGALEAMSDGKCFYCECKLDATEREVDHYIEAAEQPERAFEWGNLYLSCSGCNGKLPNKTHPCADCIDPCATAHVPANHLAFESDQIRPSNNSVVGRATIRKYRLGRADLELRRARRLNLFLTELNDIKDAMLAGGGRAMSGAEVARLRKYRQRDQPFSQMFSQIPGMP